MNTHSSCNAEEMVQKLQVELSRFAGLAPQFDCIAMLRLDTRKSRLFSLIFNIHEVI